MRGQQERSGFLFSYVSIEERILASHPLQRIRKLRGTEKVSAVFGLHVIAYNLIRLGNLLRPAMVAA